MADDTEVLSPDAERQMREFVSLFYFLSYSESSPCFHNGRKTGACSVFSVEIHRSRIGKTRLTRLN